VGSDAGNSEAAAHVGIEQGAVGGLMQDKLIPLCRLYENTSKTTGKKYFVGNLSFTSKLLILRNDEAKEGEP